MEVMKQICISRLDKMGDMILSLPAINAIKIANPYTKIYILASHKNAKILKKLNYIDKIIVVDTSFNLIALFKNIFNLRKIKFDFFLNLSPTYLSYAFCFFSNSKNKATLIFLSRYKKSIFSKLFIRLFSKLYCNYVHIVDRYSLLKNNKNIHQTKMIFELIDICRIPFNNNATINISLPQKKLNLIPLNNNLITIHLSDKWINRSYTEENFLELILKLPKKNYTYVLTSDNSTIKKFKKIYNNFSLINNKNFVSVKKLEDKITILDKLNYENWVHVIYSSKQVITPECGCSHISSACKVPVIIIYDSDNLPEAIYKEYHPWNSEHKKLIFGDMELNEKIFNNLI